MTRKQIEKRWGVSIVDDSYYDWNCEHVKYYKIYSADGCPWENGLRTLKAVERECREWNDTLLSIKREVERRYGKRI